jgi:hypothetical protein
MVHQHPKEEVLQHPASSSFQVESEGSMEFSLGDDYMEINQEEYKDAEQEEICGMKDSYITQNEQTISFPMETPPEDPEKRTYQEGFMRKYSKYVDRFPLKSLQTEKYPRNYDPLCLHARRAEEEVEERQLTRKFWTSMPEELQRLRIESSSESSSQTPPRVMGSTLLRPESDFERQENAHFENDVKPSFSPTHSPTVSEITPGTELPCPMLNASYVPNYLDLPQSEFHRDPVTRINYRFQDGHETNQDSNAVASTSDNKENMGFCNKPAVTLSTLVEPSSGSTEPPPMATLSASNEIFISPASPSEDETISPSDSALLAWEIKLKSEYSCSCHNSHNASPRKFSNIEITTQDISSTQENSVLADNSLQPLPDINNCLHSKWHMDPYTYQMVCSACRKGSTATYSVSTTQDLNTKSPGTEYSTYNTATQSEECQHSYWSENMYSKDDRMICVFCGAVEDSVGSAQLLPLSNATHVKQYVNNNLLKLIQIIHDDQREDTSHLHATTLNHVRPQLASDNISLPSAPEESVVGALHSEAPTTVSQIEDKEKDRESIQEIKLEDIFQTYDEGNGKETFQGFDVQEDINDDYMAIPTNTPSNSPHEHPDSTNPQYSCTCQGCSSSSRSPVSNAYNPEILNVLNVDEEVAVALAFGLLDDLDNDEMYYTDDEIINIEYKRPDTPDTVSLYIESDDGIMSEQPQAQEEDNLNGRNSSRRQMHRPASTELKPATHSNVDTIYNEIFGLGDVAEDELAEDDFDDTDIEENNTEILGDEDIFNRMSTRSPLLIDSDLAFALGLSGTTQQAISAPNTIGSSQAGFSNDFKGGVSFPKPDEEGYYSQVNVNGTDTEMTGGIEDTDETNENKDVTNINTTSEERTDQTGEEQEDNSHSADPAQASPHNQNHTGPVRVSGVFGEMGAIFLYVDSEGRLQFGER